MSISRPSRNPGSRWRALLVLAAAVLPLQVFAGEGALHLEKRGRHGPRWAGTGGPGAAESAPAWPRVGGHLGLALPLVSLLDDGFSAIGSDFLRIGIAPGVTIKLDEHWAFDFEFVGYMNWQFAEGATPASAGTAFVLDPGVIYDFGSCAAGLRAAVRIGDNTPFNLGLIPLLNKSFPVGDHLKWFVELDLPFFAFGQPGDFSVSLTPQVHTGVAF